MQSTDPARRWEASNGNTVVAGKAPHGNDFVGPSGESVAQLDELRQTDLAQLMDGAQETRVTTSHCRRVRCFLSSG